MTLKVTGWVRTYWSTTACTSAARPATPVVVVVGGSGVCVGDAARVGTDDGGSRRDAHPLAASVAAPTRATARSQDTNSVCRRLPATAALGADCAIPAHCTLVATCAWRNAHGGRGPMSETGIDF